MYRCYRFCCIIVTIFVVLLFPFSLHCDYRFCCISNFLLQHYKIAEYLSEKEDKQKGLIQLLKSIGIGPFNDKSKEGKEYDIDLEEIDPFTFFCYLHKYSSTRLTYIKALAEKIGAPEPQDDNG